jgi:kinesin family protein C1
MWNELLIASVPEPEAKRKPLWQKAGEYERKPAAPTSERALGTSVKNAIARPFAASVSRATTNKALKPGSGSLYGGSKGSGTRVPSNTARPKTSNGLHARSKSHHQGMRPGTAMQQQRDEDDEDDRLDRKGVPPFPISTNPKDTLKVSKNAHAASYRRPTSLNVAPKRPSHLSAPRVTSSPCTLRSFTPVTEEPADASCDEICTNFGALGLGAPEAANQGSRVGRGIIRGKESNLFPKPSYIPRATPTRQTPTPMPVWPFPTTPRTQPRFLNRFTNDYCPDFYDDRIEAMERSFAMFKEKMEGNVQQATDYKETIQQLQSKGKNDIRDLSGSSTHITYL